MSETIIKFKGKKKENSFLEKNQMFTAFVLRFKNGM